MYRIKEHNEIGSSINRDVNMRLSLLIVLFLPVVFSAFGVDADTGKVYERRMNVRQGPETVFDSDITDIIPDLKGATATNENGRVGNEMVFWGYRLADGDNVFFYACASLEGVDCALRRRSICPIETLVVAEADRNGRMSRFQCEAMCSVRPGMALPCCDESMEDNSMVVGLVKCR